MYNMSVFVHFPGRSLITDRQTDRQTNKHPYSINICRLGPTARRPRRMSVKSIFVSNQIFYTVSSCRHILGLQTALFSYYNRLFQYKLRSLTAYIILNTGDLFITPEN